MSREVWNSVGRVPAQTAGEVATIHAASFCVSGRMGNIRSPGHQGFFSHDTRFLSSLQLEINGVEPDAVDAVAMEPHEAVFILRSRSAEQGDQWEPDLVIRRHRYQGPTLHEDIVVDNHGGAEASLDVRVSVGADFADLFDIHFLGSVPDRDVTFEASGSGLAIRYVTDGFSRATEIRSSETADVNDDGLSFHAVVGPGARWKTCVDIVPVIDGRPEPIERTCRVAPVEGSPRSAASPRMRSSADALEHLWQQSRTDLTALGITVDGCRTYAAGIPWFVALFGRDSVITSMESMLVDRDVAMGTATLLGRMQGTEDDPSVSEEPGKILHEVRHGEWSREGTGTRYFGTVDATPLWCMLVDRLDRWGRDVRPLLEPLRAAIDWILASLDRGDGFLTYTGDETRLSNQGWKDSGDAMVDAEGRLLEPPIAVVEAQGYAVAALRGASRLERVLGNPARCGALEDEATGLADRIQERFWLDDLQTFDMALGGPKLRPARSVASNAGHLLWCEAVSAESAAGVARTLVGRGLNSGWGVRTLSAEHPSFHPVSYHRGSVWPHDTMMAIGGLLRYGLVDEAHHLTGGLMAAASHFSFRLPELFSGVSRSEIPAPIRYPTSSSPQAWAAAVPVSLVEELLGVRPDARAGLLALSPRLPNGVTLELGGLPMAGGVVSVKAEGSTVQILQAPRGLDIVVR